MFDATNGEWGPGHSISGLKTAEIAAELLARPKYGKALSPAAREKVLAVARDSGAYGGWGDETSLARDIVGRYLESAPAATPPGR